MDIVVVSDFNRKEQSKVHVDSVFEYIPSKHVHRLQDVLCSCT